MVGANSASWHGICANHFRAARTTRQPCRDRRAPTIGSVYRTLPAELVPQGSSALYLLNQFGASTGSTAVALLMPYPGDPVDGFRLRAVALAAALLAVALFISGRRHR